MATVSRDTALLHSVRCNLPAGCQRDVAFNKGGITTMPCILIRDVAGVQTLRDQRAGATLSVAYRVNLNLCCAILHGGISSYGAVAIQVTVLVTSDRCYNCNVTRRHY